MWSFNGLKIRIENIKQMNDLSHALTDDIADLQFCVMPWMDIQYYIHIRSYSNIVQYSNGIWCAFERDEPLQQLQANPENCLETCFGINPPEHVLAFCDMLNQS